MVAALSAVICIASIFFIDRVYVFSKKIVTEYRQFFLLKRLNPVDTHLCYT
jgi:hypothetical protein